MTTPTLYTGIVGALQASPDLALLAPGGVLDRPLVRNVSTDAARPTRGSTPTAFEANPPYRIRPCVVVPDDGAVVHPQQVRDAFAAYPKLFFYAPATASGKETIRQLVVLTQTLLDRVTVPVSADGLRAVLWVTGERFGLRDSPEFPGAVYDYIRLQAAGIWRRPA